MSWKCFNIGWKCDTEIRKPIIVEKRCISNNVQTIKKQVYLIENKETLLNRYAQSVPLYGSEWRTGMYFHTELCLEMHFNKE